MLRRFPRTQDILPVYAVIATVVFTWSIITFFWKLPSWLFFLHVGEILSILAYTFSLDLLESLAWLGILLLGTLILPGTILRDNFAARGSSISLIILGSLALFVNRFEVLGQKLIRYFSLWMIMTLVLAILLAYLSTKIRAVGSAILWFADRLIVFLYLLIPLGSIALLIVLIRNLV